jgi:hypothetical protein
MVVHGYDPSTQEAEVGGLQVGGQPRLYRETLSQKEKKTEVICVFPYFPCAMSHLSVVIEEPTESGLHLLNNNLSIFSGHESALFIKASFTGTLPKLILSNMFSIS